jgi:pseudouridine-5'-phosphate glycosidase
MKVGLCFVHLGTEIMEAFFSRKSRKTVLLKSCQKIAENITLTPGRLLVNLLIIFSLLINVFTIIQERLGFALQEKLEQGVQCDQIGRTLAYWVIVEL